MGKRKIVLFVFALLVASSAIAGSFSSEEFQDRIHIMYENDSDEDIHVPCFKRGPTTIPLLFSEDGTLFHLKELRKPDSRDFFSGTEKVFYKKSYTKKTLAFLIYRDLRQFDLDQKRTSKKILDGSLFLTGFSNIRQPNGDLLSIGVFTLSVRNGVIASVSLIDERKLPEKILHLAKSEMATLCKEEKY